MLATVDLFGHETVPEELPDRAPPRPHDPFAGLTPFGYHLIMADPPWRFELYSPKGEAKSAQAQYRTMTIEEIAALPVGTLAAGDAVLWLWCTWPLLLDGANPARSPVGEVMRRWGFRYATGGAWAKRTKRGKTAFGTGYRLRSACEPFLIGVCGEPRTARDVRNLIEGEAREHSRKPEAAYRAAEALLPGARRLELFSRASRPGWETWGDEAGKFDGEGA